VVEKFRAGSFEDATDEVQKAWLFCMMELMPCINADVAKKGGLPLSQHLLLECGAPGADAFPMTTRSDEALIYWFFHAYFEKEWNGAVARDLGKRKILSNLPWGLQPKGPKHREASISQGL
jgi:hypothetical protein